MGSLGLALVAGGEVSLAQDSARACPTTYADAEASDVSLRATSEARVRAAAAAHTGQTPPARLSATYVARSREAAIDLAAWWAAQPKVGVEVRAAPAANAAELAAYAQIRAQLPPGATFTPASDPCPAWTVHVEGAPGALAKADVAAWFDRLAEVPADARWKLRGIGVAEPEAAPSH